MRSYLKIGFVSICFLLLAVVVVTCKKEKTNEVPVLKTLAIKNLSPTSVSSGGDISSAGSSFVNARGVCWSTLLNPTAKYKDSMTVDGGGTGTFECILSGLKPGVTYNIRAYANNSAGMGYGNQVTVALAPIVPTVATAVITPTSFTSLVSGGKISSDGGSPVTARGVCWNTAKNPTINNFATLDSTGTGSFVSTIIDLLPDVVYYFRAYATNSIGTAYGAERSFSLGKSLVKDMDGNFYRFVSIGSQTWMTENLKTTRFRDSTAIALIENNTTWSSTSSPGYSWYDNDPENKNKYGALYNWYTVSSGRLCPTGWRVPSDNDWKTLTDYLGGEPVAGGKLKETGTLNWQNPNSGATNTTGFTALPAGSRNNLGEFGTVGNYGNWWTSTSTISNVANYRYIYFGNTIVTKSFVSQKYGLSVRCIKN